MMIARILALLALAGGLAAAPWGPDPFTHRPGAGKALAQGKAKTVKQDPPARRIGVSAAGRDAIGRVSGRLAFALQEAGLRLGAPVYLRVIKADGRLEVYVRGRQGRFQRFRDYKVCGGGRATGARRNARGGQPEGFYAIGADGLRPAEVSYLGLDIGWPNAFDRAQGWQGGGPVAIQGGCAGAGQIGLTDQDAGEVYALVHAALAGGQASVPLHVFPFAMTRLARLTQTGPAAQANAAFWDQLQPAWVGFERTKTPPRTEVQRRRYVVLP
jgi:murein L,D-transpeptidase YafK